MRTGTGAGAMRRWRRATRCGNSQLPLFEAGTPGGEYITPTLPLALYDLGVNLDSSGFGAPLALWLFVEAIATLLYGRRLGQPIVLNEITVRCILNRLYG